MITLLKVVLRSKGDGKCTIFFFRHEKKNGIRMDLYNEINQFCRISFSTMIFIIEPDDKCICIFIS